MAPMPRMGKQRVLELLAERGPPLRFGSPHPCVAIVHEDGVYRLRDLVIDEAEAHAMQADAVKNRTGFMPEHYYGLGKPTGKIHLEAPTLQAFREKLEAFAWPQHW